MGRKIILLSDGTGNSSAKVWRTNVWRTFEALDLSGNDQVAYYDDGVGTSSFKPTAILGGIFGYGLKRNVIAIYKFACRNHRDADDEFYAFGFSRGAFTIRIVCALILTQGLVSAESELELDQLARAAYRKYRRERFHTIWHIEAIFRAIRDLFVSSDPGATRHVRSIRFLGVWDTVAAYGLPIDEMARGISKWLWPLEIPSHKLLRDPATGEYRVERACQALSLDEERTTFHPELWDERDPLAPPFDPTAPRFIKDERISQVWFAGVHSNIGGGYPDDSLSLIPFVWMITEARRCGLKFKSDYADDPTNLKVQRADPDTFRNAIARRDKDGRIYDPRAGFGAYYRYGPRKLVDLCYPPAHKREGDEVIVDRPKIHHTVFDRIKNRAHAYAPIGVPPRYDVVTENGEILTPDMFGFESNLEAARRSESQENVWDQVWKRRIVYFTTLVATAWLLIFPFIGVADVSEEVSSPIRWLSDIIRAIGAFLPKWSSPWIEGYARAPFQFSLALLIVVTRLFSGKTLEMRLRDQMTDLWLRPRDTFTGLPTGWIYTLRDCAAYQRGLRALKFHLIPALFAFGLIYVGAMFASHIAYNLQDVAGLTCRNYGWDNPAAASKLTQKGEVRIFDFDIANLCQPTGIMLEKGVTYAIRIDPVGEWRDRGFVIPPGGFTDAEPSRGWLRVIHSIALPLRRELFEEWFRITLRYGRIGGEEQFLYPDPTDPILQTRFKPTVSGELFMFVNDAVIGIPGLYDVFYKNNSGKATVAVTRRSDP